jgi:hypothetical protein
MGRFIPPDGMDIVRKVLADVVTPNRGTFLSLGFLATLWTASGGFAAAIEALNIAYDAEETGNMALWLASGSGTNFPPERPCREVGVPPPFYERINTVLFSLDPRLVAMLLNLAGVFGLLQEHSQFRSNGVPGFGRQLPVLLKLRP